jgi:hypothetical protein
VDPCGGRVGPAPRERRAAGPDSVAELSRSYPSLNSPAPALNRVAAWAVARAGGHLRVDPADPAPRAFGADEFAELIEDAERWDRVRTDQVIDPNGLLARLVGGLFGVRMDGPGGRLELCPWLPEGWRSMALRRLRAGRTVLDVEVRPRAEWVTIRLAVTFGPPLAALVRLPREFPVGRVTVDEVPLPSDRAVFTAREEHEVVLFRSVTS